MNNLLPHKIALVFPPMDATTFNDLVASMRAGGFDKRHPVILFEGKILDGINRTRAAAQAGVQIVTEEFVGTGKQAAEFSLRENLHRRHLDEGQRAMIAADMLKFVDDDTDKAAGEDMKPKATAKTVAIANHISPRTVVRAQELRNLDPKAAEAVKSGRVKLGTALRKAKAAAAAPARPVLASNARDSAGATINPIAYDHLTRGRSKFQHWGKELVRIKREILACASDPLGRMLTSAAIEADFANLVRQLANAAPYSSCPLEAKCEPTCKLCRGTQWITKNQFDSLPKGFKP